MRTILCAIAGLLASLCITVPALAQCDPPRLPATQRFEPTHGLTFAVYENELIMGGGFTSPGRHVARWNGHVWRDFSTANVATPYALTVHGGRLIAGGSMGAVQWTGSAWQVLGGGVDSSRAVSTLTTHNGDLIAAGTFLRIGGVPATRVAAWNGTAWRAMDAGFDKQVMSVTTFRGELIAGGLFTQSGGRMVKCIARWDGSRWQQLGPGVDGAVITMAEYRGDLIIGGRFYTAAGQTMNFITRWDGQQYHPMGAGVLARPGYEFITYVGGMAIYQGELYVGGLFDYASGVHSVGLARWDGTEWHAVSGSTDTVRALAVFNHEVITADSTDAFWSRFGCPPCIADVDDDGQVDFSDYLAFLDLYRTADPLADLTEDGMIDRSDWLEFLGVYSAGCP